MKRTTALTLLSSCLLSTAALAAISPNHFDAERTPHIPTRNQFPIAAMSEDNNSGSNPTSKLIISDVLARESSISIFVGLIRDVESASKRLQDSSSNTTVLAPLNAELMKMPRKPWEDPEDYSAFGTNAYEGAEGESRAQRNLRKFVESHLVPASPWVVGQKMKTLAESNVSLEEKDGEKILQPDGVAVANVAEKVSNGEVWIVRGVLSRPSS